MLMAIPFPVLENILFFFSLLFYSYLTSLIPQGLVLKRFAALSKLWMGTYSDFLALIREVSRSRAAFKALSL